MRILTGLAALLALACLALPVAAQTPVACPAPAGAVVCFQFPNAAIVNWSWAPPRPVIPLSRLADALSIAKGGDTILVGGPPVPVLIKGRSFSPPVTIASADSAHPAVLNGLQLVGDVGLIFDSIDVTLTNPVSQGSAVVAVTNSSGIAFKTVNITGVMDPAAKCGWFGKGFALTGGDHVSFSGGSISHVYKGFSVAGGSDHTLQDADLHDVDTSAIDGGGDLARLNFLRNAIHDMVPVAACGQHYDGWHFWSKNSTGPIDGVLIDGNTFTQASGNGSSAINFEGTSIAGGPGFTHARVTNNTLRWNSTQGLSTNYTQATVANNLFYPAPGLDNPAHAPRFVVRQGSEFVAHGNTWTCGPSSKPYPDNTCLTPAQITAMGAPAATLSPSRP